MKSKELLDDFTDYCKANPDMRFWQALCCWAGAGFLYVGSSRVNIIDTWYSVKRSGK